MSKRAVVLAGGKGTRLLPYTVVLPKPLMPIGDYPILEVVVRQLVRDGFDHITMAVNHQADLIQAFFGDGSKWSVDIDYSMEDKPLSTMGPLKLIGDLPQDFLIMNGDVLTDLDYHKFFEFHVGQQNLLTISSMQRRHVSEYGVLQIDGSQYLQGFQEKPAITYQVSMGVYMANRAVLEYIPDNQPYGFDDLMLHLMDIGKPPMVRMFDGIWLDIGRVDDYREAIDIFEAKRDSFLRDD